MGGSRQQTETGDYRGREVFWQFHLRAEKSVSWKGNWHRSVAQGTQAANDQESV
jgi:hypothetical protein